MTTPQRLVIPSVTDGGFTFPSAPLPDAALRAVSCASDNYVVATGAVTMLDPGMGFGTHGLQRLEALGVNTSIQDIPPTGVARAGFPIEGSDVRFGIEADPENPAKKAYRFALSSTDPLTAAATRIEASTLGYWLQEDADFTIGFAVRTGTWSSANDEQVLFQAKSVDTQPGNPYLALTVGQGTGRWYIRSNANNPPLQASNTVTLASTTPWMPNAWQFFVVQLRRHWLPDKGAYVRVWQNGNLVVDFTGPISYNLVNDVSQVKIGVYHYTPPAWEAPLDRVAYFKGLYIWPGTVSVPDAQSVLEQI